MRRAASRSNRLIATAVPIVVLAVVVAAAVLLVDSGAERPLPAGSARVIDVIDGDTLVLDLAGAHETTRLLGIDTPEVHHPTKPVECFGAEASARLAELAPPGTIVRVERDDEARDHYDRLLAYVFAPSQDGTEVFVNLQLVTEGAAVTLPIDPNDAHRSELAEAERAAQAADAGLWAACGGPGVPVDPLAGR